MTSFPNMIRAAQALLLVIAVCFTLGASDSASRFNNLNHSLMCTCSCNEVLGECNHVSCPMSGPEQAELTAALAAGKSDNDIFAAFAAEYGATVLAAPTTHGFDLVAWIAPFAVFAAALLGTFLLIHRWSIGKSDTTAPDSDPSTDALRMQIRRETSGNGEF